MDEPIDWSEALYAELPNLADFKSIVGSSDRAFLDGLKGDLEANVVRLHGLEAQVLQQLVYFAVGTVGTMAAVYERRLALLMHANGDPEQCFQLFRQRCMLGFSSPLEKGRLLTVILNYLEKKESRNNVRVLCDRMREELLDCIEACKEQLGVLETF